MTVAFYVFVGLFLQKNRSYQDLFCQRSSLKWLQHLSSEKVHRIYKKGAKVKTFYTTSALGLLLSTVCVSALAEVEMEKTGWQTPLATEFSRLDATGNGLLKRNEVGKAFNRKSFDKADVDHDGYIDQNEFIYYKTGAWPESMQSPQTNMPVTTTPDTVTPSSEMPTEMAPPSEVPAEMVPPNDGLSLYDLNEEGMSAELQSLMDAHEQTLHQAQEKANGDANVDHIINAKAITTILATDDLEGLQINVATFQGEVMLNGFVNTQQDKIKAETVVSQISGVKAVINDLVVRS